MIENWKPVPSIPTLLASNKGRIMVKPYLKDMPYGGQREYGGHGTYGVWQGTRYIYVYKGKTLKVARLVCEAFNGLPTKEKPFCLHKDENAKNNVPDNLKWGTQKENLNCPGFLKYCSSRVGDKHPSKKCAF